MLPQEAAQLFEMIKGNFLLSQVVFELAREPGRLPMAAESTDDGASDFGSASGGWAVLPDASATSARSFSRIMRSSASVPLVDRHRERAYEFRPG
jgi:hypothetical protein